MQLPSRADPLVAAASPAVGGRAGSRVRPASGWWTPLRVCLALTVLAGILSVIRISPCLADGWTGGDQFRLGCYSDIGVLYGSRGLEGGASPFNADEPLEYPVLTSLTAGVTAWLTDRVDAIDGQRSSSVQRTQTFFMFNAVILLSAWVVAVALIARATSWRPWDAALLALAPGVLLAGLVNWDLLAAVCVVAALLAMARRRPLWAGVLLGLGASLKLYPILLLLPIVLIAWRRRDPQPAVRAILGAAIAWFAVNVPAYLAAPEAWARFYELSRERSYSWGSVWLALSDAGWFDATRSLNVLGPALFAAACLGLVALTWRAPVPPRLGQLAFLVVAAFLIVNKVYSPQFVVWLATLLPFARPRWPAAAAWFAAEAVYFVAVWAHLEGVTNPDSMIPTWPHTLATFVRLGALLVLMGLIVRDVLHPEADVVRTSTPPGAGDDPLWPVTSVPADDAVEGGGRHARVHVQEGAHVRSRPGLGQ